MADNKANLFEKRVNGSKLTAISVMGYKSVISEQRIEIRPLTILAGANSGGKSSIIQPLLLLKQTLEASFDPGSLLLDGPNVRLTSSDQLLSKLSKTKFADEFSIRLELGRANVGFTFRRASGKGLEITRNSIVDPKRLLDVTIDPSWTQSNAADGLKRAGIPFADEILRMISRTGKVDQIPNEGNLSAPDEAQNYTTSATALRVFRDRCFLVLELMWNDGLFGERRYPVLHPSSVLGNHIAELIHVPGLRGNPERNYRTTAFGNGFPGTFEFYVASVINHWQSDQDERLSELNRHLERLGLTWKVQAEQLDETQVELKVARLPRHERAGAKDLVSIADVGFGVSQTLPVLVGLLAAAPGQIVYIEQPEIHLHPRAQRALATVLAEAAQRGVTVIVETHSALLLRSIQTLVAKNDLSPDLIKLHWFQRDASGATSITSADLDDTGAFGEWPGDFDEVALESENDYLSAAEAKLFEKK